MASKRIFDIIFKTKGIDKAKSGVSGLGGALGKMTKIGVLAGAGIATLSVKLAGDFSKSLAEVSTLMDKTSEKSIKAMSKELRLLSQTSGLALSSLSKAKYDIVSSGFSGAAQSAQVLAASSQLAVGGVTSAASAADLLTTALNAYGLGAGKVNDVSDILFTTVKLGKTTMDELAGSLGKVLPIAKSAGVSLTDIGAAMASLTAGGINTAESTTALRGAIIALTAPTDAAAKAMEKGGIEAKKFDDGSFDLLETIKQFEGMDPAALRKFIPDISASVAVSALANNVQGLSDNLTAFEGRAGASETAFNKMAGEFNTQMAMLKNTSQSVMIEIGNVIIDAILPSITSANESLATMGEIGWDVIAQRMVEGTGHLKLILKDAVAIIGEELFIIGSKMGNKLPWWLGGIDDEELALNIAVSEQLIKSKMRTMMVEVQALTKELTAPPPVDEEKWEEWKDRTNEILDEMKVGEGLKIRKPVLKSVTDYKLKLEKVPPVIDDLNKGMLMQVNTAGMLSSALQTAFDPSLGAGHAFKGFIIQLMSSMQGVILASKAVSEALSFAFIPGVGIGAAMAALVALEAAKAGVRSIKFAEFGMDEMISKPTLIMAGEAGPERVSITPTSRPSSGQSGGGMTINFLGPVTNKEFVRDTIIPEINRVQNLGLA